MNIVTIWNYFSDSKKLIGKSNALADALPFNCTTIAPPDIPEGQEAIFDTDSQQWLLRDIAPPAIRQVITVYGYTPDMMIYTGSASALADSLPPNSTTVAPDIDPAAGHVLTFDTATQTWALTEDHRGETVYSTLNGQATYIGNVGPYPENSTTLAPDVPFPVWGGSAWGTDTDAQNAANIQLNTATYRRLMQLVVLAQCPLNSSLSQGVTLTEAQQSTLSGLQQYAISLSAFIQSTDLTQTPLAFPEAAPGLLDYPVVLNTQFSEK